MNPPASPLTREHRRPTVRRTVTRRPVKGWRSAGMASGTPATAPAVRAQSSCRGVVPVRGWCRVGTARVGTPVRLFDGERVGGGFRCRARSDGHGRVGIGEKSHRWSPSQEVAEGAARKGVPDVRYRAAPDATVRGPGREVREGQGIPSSSQSAALARWGYRSWDRMRSGPQERSALRRGRHRPARGGTSRRHPRPQRGAQPGCSSH
jgi:hypothetical protein